jgi:DNA adenine methylase
MPAVPPIKCQGIKTKIIAFIQECVPQPLAGCWIEPFCGSCVVALNMLPERALLSDTNRHIIQFYRHIQAGIITPGSVRAYLEHANGQLRQHGEDYYYEVRSRFNREGDSLDFLFLNRACFNGVMRFNRKGEFNVPFGHKPERFRPAYITKIVNQVKRFQMAIAGRDWRFEVADFRTTLAQATSEDFVYVDPPYIGRHTDYFNTWNETDEEALIAALQNGSARFLLSTWHHNRHRANPAIERCWQDERFFVRTVEHFYHVGSTESLRGTMTEALIGNYRWPLPATSLP